MLAILVRCVHVSPCLLSSFFFLPDWSSLLSPHSPHRFDKCYAGAVFMRRDPDGSRAEILCTGCHSHLGHVFTGEGMTPTDERHCVNSVSIVYDASAPSESVREVMLT